MAEKDKQSITRRGFLKGAGVTAAGSLILEQTQALAKDLSANGREARALGPEAVPITLRVNGRAYRLNIEPRSTLAEALRDHLELTGTKVVCDRGSCSACTIWLDGTPALACMTLAVDVGRREVTTVEGLSNGDALHPVQAAFVKHDAMQCGFCTPGMVMSCAALLKQNPAPSLDEIKHAVSGNLCRCGTYPKIFDAMLEIGTSPANSVQSAVQAGGKGEFHGD